MGLVSGIRDPGSGKTYSGSLSVFNLAWCAGPFVWFHEVERICWVSLGMPGPGKRGLHQGNASPPLGAGKVDKCNTEPREARVLPWLQSCPDQLEKRCGWAWFEQQCSAASYCELQLPLFFAFCDVNHPMPSHVRTLWINSVVWRADRCHCQAAELMLYIYRIFLKVQSFTYIIK